MSEDHKTCPSCQKLSPNESRICIHCGYDWATGKTKKTIFQKKFDFRRHLSLIVLSLLFAGMLGWFFTKASSRKTSSKPSEAPVATTSIQDLQQQDFKQWESQFETQSPLLQVGQKAKLEMTTGQIRQVQIQAIRAQSVMVISDQGQDEISFLALRPKSRAQLDTAYRRQIILKARERILSP